MEILFKTKFKVMRHCASKNEKTIRYNRQTNKPFIGKTDDAILAEKYMINRLTIEKLKNRIETIDCDVNLKAIFYIPSSVFWTKKKERNKKIGDLENLLSLVQDCLQKSGIIKDDTLICSLDGSRRMPIDGTEYFLEIELTRAI
jgi:Holliday junction resolvase RusA-like endonuclease